MYDDIDNGTRINDEPNPFTPVYYDERRNAPQKRPARADADVPMRPGQMYTGAYDKWMSRPAPLAPTGGAGEQPYESADAYDTPQPPEPLRFREPVPRTEAEAGYTGSAVPSPAPTAASQEIPSYLRKAPRLAPFHPDGGARPHDASMLPPEVVQPLYQKPPPTPADEPTVGHDVPPALERRRSRSQSHTMPERRRRTDRRETDEAYEAQPMGERHEPPAWDFAPMPRDAAAYSPPAYQDAMTAQYHGRREPSAWDFASDTPDTPDMSAPPSIPPRPDYMQYSDQAPVFGEAYAPGLAGFAPDDAEAFVPNSNHGMENMEPADEIASFFSDGEPVMPADAVEAPSAYVPIPVDAPSIEDTGQNKQAEPPAPVKSAPKPAEKRRIRPWRLAALISIVAMIAFVLIAGGSILSDLARNQQEMSDFREAYREQMGVSPEQDGDLVALLPYGQTFAPTATPYAAPTTEPDNVASAVQAGATGDAQDEGIPATVPPRTRLTAYPDNPLRNILPDIAELRKENPDVSGRLTINGVLDEVVVQRNNTYYLTHNYRGGAAASGAVFIDESCSLKTPPENLLLRGQDVEADKAFAPLWRFSTGGSAFVSGATRARLTTLYEEAEYVLFAVIIVNTQSAQRFNYAGCPSFSTDEEMLAHVDAAIRQSQYKFNVTVDASDRLLTLATVGSGEETLVLMYRMVRAGERSR